MKSQLAFIATQLHGAAAQEPQERHIDFVRFDESGKTFMVQVILSTVSSPVPVVQLTFFDDITDVNKLVNDLLTHEGIRSIKVFQWELGVVLLRDVYAERAAAFNEEFGKSLAK